MRTAAMREGEHRNNLLPECSERMGTNMKEFSFSTRIFFGDSALKRLNQVVNKRVLIVTDDYMQKSGTVDHVAGFLTNCQVSVFDKVQPEPSIEIVSLGVKFAVEMNAQVIVALGGGSALDAAKAISVISKRLNPDTVNIEECFAIPTTSGTGSEVTDYSVITDTERGIKYPLYGEKFRPATAILDPELVATAPPQVTAATGMDVLTHAIEAYVSENASDFTDALAEKAVTLCMRFLPLAYKDGGDLLAREKMHNASCLAGLAFNTSGLGLNHSIAHAVGAKLHISHGKINAMLLPFVIDFNANLAGAEEFSVTARKYQRIAKISDLSAPSVIVGVAALHRAIAEMNKLMQIPATLRENGTDLKLFDSLRNEIVAAALDDVCTKTNPRSVKAEDVEAILKRVRG